MPRRDCKHGIVGESRPTKYCFFIFVSSFSARTFANCNALGAGRIDVRAERGKVAGHARSARILISCPRKFSPVSRQRGAGKETAPSSPINKPEFRIPRNGTVACCEVSREARGETRCQRIGDPSPGETVRINIDRTRPPLILERKRSLIV